MVKPGLPVAADCLGHPCLPPCSAGGAWSHKHHGHKQDQRETEESFWFVYSKLQTVVPCHTVPWLSVPFWLNLSQVPVPGQTLVTVNTVSGAHCLPANVSLDNLTV